MNNSTKHIQRVRLAWTLLAAAIVASAPAASMAAGYSFTKIGTLGVSPNFGDFECGAINNSAAAVFVSETSSCLDSIFGPQTLCEGVFLYQGGLLSQIVTSANPLPGGGTFANQISGPAALNSSGQAAMALFQVPLQFPLGLNAGVFQFSGGSLSAVMVPGTTKVPGVRGNPKFQGAVQGTGINNSGGIVFCGMIPTSAGVNSSSLGVGVFTAGPGGLAKIVVPGDPAPGGGTFDYAQNAGINDQGDVVFEAHLTGAECIGGPQLPYFLACGATGAYLKRAGSSSIIKMAQQGDLDPSGIPFRHCWGPVANSGGQVLFVGDLTPPPNAEQADGLYLYNSSTIAAVVRPGDMLPGGGTVQSATSGYVHSYGLNDLGSVSFTATLQGGSTGVYVSSGGAVRLVTRTGIAMPGIGIYSSSPGGLTGQLINDSGQLLFAATLSSGATVLVLASPIP